MTTECKKLLSKGTNSRLEPRNAKSLAETKDLCGENPDSGESAIDEKLNDLILADQPNLYKQIGASMPEKGFLALSREFLEDPSFNGMRISYQRLLLIMAREAVWKKTKWDISHNEIWLMPGQLCASFKWLAEKYNEDLRFDEDKIDKALVQRAVSVFLQLRFAIQESIHGKSVFTILMPMTYVSSELEADTETDTKPIRNRYANEQSKQDKQKGTSSLRARRESSFLPKKEKKKEKFPFTEEDVELITTYFMEKNVKIKTEVLRRWMSKYDKEAVLYTFGMMMEYKGKIGTHEGFMGKALQDDWAHLRGNNPINKKWFDDLVHPKKTEIWERKDAFVQNRTNGDTFAFALPPETFQPAVLNALNFEE